MVNFYHLPITGIDDDDNDDRGVIYFCKGRAFCRATLLYIIYILYIRINRGRCQLSTVIAGGENIKNN